MTPSKYAICVATLVFDRPNLTYFEEAFAINEIYCRRHGYAQRIFEPPQPELRDDRNPIWYKVKGVRELLPSYDYVVFIDADAYFYDQDQRIEVLIEQYLNPPSLVLIGADWRDRNFKWTDGVNTGAWIIANEPDSFRLLDDWWNSVEKPGCEWYRWTWPPEQLGLNSILPQYSSRISIVPYYVLNGRDGLFVRHLMGMSNDSRLDILKEARESLGRTWL